jgi:hypothetical protein
MDKKIEKVLSFLEEKYGDLDGFKYPKERITEIVTNCVSLINALFDRVRNEKSLSFEIKLYNKEGVLVETINGVDKNNAYETIADIIINKSNFYSKLSLDSFKYERVNKVVNAIGELEVS